MLNRFFLTIEKTLSGATICCGLWGGSYSSAEIQSMYSTAPTDWAEPIYVRLSVSKEITYLVQLLVWCIMQYQHLWDI